MTTLEGKVAAIISDEEIVINKGRADGITPGDKFRVLDPRGWQIKDPDSGRILGDVRREKLRVKVVQVEENLSVARADKNTLGYYASLIAASTASVLSRALLPVSDSTVSEVVKVGDWVEGISEQRDEQQVPLPVTPLFEG